MLSTIQFASPTVLPSSLHTHGANPAVIASVLLVVVAVAYQSFAPLPHPVIKLTYFGSPGRTEATRVALKLGGVEFHDERLTRTAFLQLKPLLPYGQVPILTVDGQVFAESQAILRYAGRVAGLYPVNDAVAKLLVDEIITAIDEIRELHLTHLRRETDPEKQRLLREALVAGPLPAALSRIDTRLAVVAKHSSFSKDKIYLHEVSAWGFVTIFKQARFDHIPTTVANEYVTLSAIHAKVEAAIAKLPAKPQTQQVTPRTVPRPQSLTLTYFDIPIRAQPIRLAFHIGGVSFEDERLSWEAFLERKPTLPYGQVPVLTVDGSVTAAQSFALLRYAGSLSSGMYPLHLPTEALKIDEIIARVEDVYYALWPSRVENDQDRKRAMREQLAADHLPTMYALLEKRVTQWKQTAPYVLGHKLTLADLAVLNLMHFCKSGNMDFVPVSIMDGYEALNEVHDTVMAHERVVDWYAKITK